MRQIGLLLMVYVASCCSLFAYSQVETPTFSVAAGTYSGAQSVTIGSATSGATIYYTTDGSTPTTSSTQYSSALNISSTMTVKAIAAKSGLTNSAMATATYTIRSWSHYRTVTVDHTKVSGSAALTNFPMLFSATIADLRITANGGDVQDANGYDIAFAADQQGTALLDYEVERYDAATGELVAWVKIPSLSHSADTTIFLVYGEPNVTSSLANPTGVWDSSYKGVYHLSTGTSLSTQDSTSQGNNGTANTVAAAIGTLGGGATWNGTSSYISIPSAAFGAHPTGGSTTNYTVAFSAWFKSTATGVILGQNNGVLPPNGTSSYVPALYLDTAGRLRASVFYHGNTNPPASTNAYNDGAWHQVTVTYSNGTEAMYVDGALIRTQSSLSVHGYSSTYTYLVGAMLSSNWSGTSGGWSYFSGSLDEVRVSSTAPSADWISTEYNNQYSPSSFFGVGGEQLPGVTAAPTFSPIAGTYTTTQAVSINSATSGATIHYTVDLPPVIRA